MVSARAEISAVVAGCADSVLLDAFAPLSPTPLAVTAMFVPTLGDAKVPVAPELLIVTASDPTTPTSDAPVKLKVAESESSKSLSAAVMPVIVRGFAFTVIETGVVVEAAE